MMQQIQQDLMNGVASMSNPQQSQGMAGNRLVLPTNEGQAPPAYDQRTFPPTSPAEQNFAIGAQSARNGQVISRGQYGELG
jgi:hypothetical protein